jgi:hypothetical protein
MITRRCSERRFFLHCHAGLHDPEEHLRVDGRGPCYLASSVEA